MVQVQKMFYVPVLATIALLAAACDQQGSNRGENTSGTAARSGALPMEKRILREKTYDEGKRQVEIKEVAFANWLARCQYHDNKGPSEDDDAYCSLSPWGGRIRRGRPQPLHNGVTVQLSKNRKPQLVIGGSRAPDSTYELVCGYTRVSGEGYKTKYLYDDEAAPFLDAMTQSDCELEFTPRGATSPKIQKMPQRGFTEALEFGKAYVRSLR